MKKIIIFITFVFFCMLITGCVYVSPDEGTLNATGFNGKGMDINIKVFPKAQFDPFDPDYTGEDKQERQKHQLALEKAYDIKIKYVDYTDSEPWGPSRVQAINEGHLDGERIGDIYQISTDWIPTLAGSQSIASLYQTDTKQGYFDDFDFEPASISQDVATYRNNVYAYINGEPRPDYFMYFNADLVRQVGLKDPAQMWLDHEWTWSNFKAYLDLAKGKEILATDDYKLLSGIPAEFLLGFTSAQGGEFVDPSTNSLMWANENVTGIISDLKAMFAKNYIDTDTYDISPSFLNGKAMFITGSLWFMGNMTHFSPDLPFEIGAVPYPVSDDSGDTLSSYKVPVHSCDAFAVANVDNGLNGLSSKILFNILDDLQRGMKSSDDDLTPEVSYQNWLESKFDSQIYVDAIMSVQDPKYQYFEKIFMVSMTLVQDAHLSYGMYTILNGIITGPTTDALTTLETVRTRYEEVLANYN